MDDVVLDVEVSGLVLTSGTSPKRQWPYALYASTMMEQLSVISQ